MRAFISYAHQNETRVERLKNNLEPLKRDGVITLFDDHQILPGENWNEALSGALNAARLVLLCVSDFFLRSRYIYDNELKVALAKHDDGSARVIPVILTYCNWEGLRIGGRRLGELQAVPDKSKPIQGWKPVERGYTDAAQRIERAVRRDLAGGRS